MKELTAFCPKCFKEQQIINPKLETLQSGQSIARGNCISCNTEIASIVPPTTSQRELEETEKIQKQELEKKKFKEEEKKVKEYVNESNLPPNKKKLIEHGYNPPMRRSYYNLIRFGLFLTSLLVIIFLYRTYYSEEFVPTYDSVCEMDCGNNTISCPEIPDFPTYSCPICNLTCGDCMPDIKINLNNTE